MILNLVNGTKRPVWLTIPVVIVPSRPYGLPIAITGCPMLTLDEFPIVRGVGRDVFGCCALRERFSTILSTAMSSSGSLPITFAVRLLPFSKRTLTILVSPTACFVVTMCP